MMKGGLLVFLVFIIASAYSIAVQSQANSELQELFGDDDEAEVIVVLKDDYNALQGYGISSNNNNNDFEIKKMMIRGQQEDVLGNLKLKKKDNGLSAQNDADYDFDLTNTYATVNGFAGKLKKASYQKLKNNPRVKNIEKSIPFEISLDTSKEQVNASNTWRLVYNSTNLTGKGESVCIIDTGVDYTHQFLGGCTSDSFIAGTCSKVIGGNNYCVTDACNSQNNTPLDNNGHGTHVAGIVASTNDTFRGIAPDAAIVAIKSLNSSGGGTTPSVVAGIDWCVNNASRFNISVISMSLGTTTLFSSYCDSASSLFTDAIANAIKNNISVIAATGNDGSTSGISLPACITNVTSVGSVGDTDAIPSYSNRNSITDLLAPGGANSAGNHIKSTVPTGSCELCDTSGFKELSGTSMATPHVAAAFALLRQYRRLEQNVILTPIQIQDFLNDTGKQISDSGLTFSRINIYAAILSLDIIAPNINFVEPTPANNSNFKANSTDDYIFINITSSEVLKNPMLEWNGTNETMQGSGLNWFKNKTNFNSITSDISFKIWGNDSSNNIGLSLTRVITISDTIMPGITLVNPTPANGTNLSLNSTEFFVYINASTTEVLSSAILEINNGSKINISMTINALNSFINLTALKLGVITFRIYGNDSAGNLNITELRTLQINNTAPNISAFSPSNISISIVEPNSQSFSINFSDSENDTVTFFWYLNNSLRLSGANKSDFNFTGNTTASGFYIINVTLNDGAATAHRSWSLTVNNTNNAVSITSFSPNQTAIEIAESNNRTFNITYSDLDSDDTITVKWYQNGTLKATNVNFTFTGNSTAAGFYNITAIVTDGTNTTTQSWNLTVFNPAPNITSTPVATGIEGVAYRYRVVAVDDDNDDLTFSDNTSLFNINSLSGLISFIPNTVGSYTINITVSDEINETSQIYNLSIEKSNSNNTISSPFTNGSVVSGDSVVIKLTTSNYANCSYSMDKSSFKEFSGSTTGYWKVGTSTKKFELSEDLTIGGINRELLRNITTYIDRNNLIGLASDSVTNSKNISPYNQYLYSLGPGVETGMDTGYVLYIEDDDTDTSADWLYFKSGREIGRYLLIFEPVPFESGIYDNNSNPSQLGLNLKDFKNVTIKIFGKDYKIIEAKRTSPNGNGIRLIFANKTADALVKNTFFVKDTLLEKQTKSYTIKDKNYTITLNFVDPDEAQFVVNNQATEKLKINWTQDLTDNLVIEVNDILYQDFAGGVHRATFSISAEEITTTQKFELRDDNVEDSKSMSALKVNDNTIDDAFVIIEGSDDNTIFKINRIHVNMTADDNFFVGKGGKLSDAIKSAGGSLAEPEVLFTQNWDIAYKGLTNESIETIKIKTNGLSEYRLEFLDGDGNKVSLPIAKVPSGTALRFGELDSSRAFINKENRTISKDDYFILSNSNSSRKRGERPTYALQYKGADKVANDNPVLKFKNLGSGIIIEKIYSNKTTSIIGPEGSILTELAALNFSNSNFTVYAVGNINTNDFGVVIDFDANGLIISGPTPSLTAPLPITTKNGMEINITNETGNIGEDTSDVIFVTFRIPDESRDGFARDSVENLLPTVMRWNITASSGEVRLVQDTTTEPKRINLRTPNGQTNIAYGYDSYGDFYTYETPTTTPQLLTIEVPSKQRLPLVYYENGGLHSQLLSNITKGSHNITINCSDIFGAITDYHFSFNAATTPNVTSHLPANGSMNISIKSNIIINFSENIDKSTIEKSSIIIQDINGEKIKWIYLYNDTINQTIVDPINFLKDNTTYLVNVTTRIKSIFGRNLNKDYVWNFTTAKKDIDNDGIPDEEDNDKDNDGIDDNLDFFRGNLTNINSNFFNLSLIIDSDENVSKYFNGTKKLEFRIKDKKLLEFDFNFSNNFMLDLSNLSILNASNSSLGAVVVRGISLSKFGFKKIAYVERLNNNKNGICVKDEEIDWIDNISDNCNGQNEFRVECDGSTQNGYACAYNSSSNLYRVTGLSHSGIIQLLYTQSSSSGSTSSSSSSSGSSGGGGGDGGGGGGGGAAGFICNMDWKCSEWSGCIDGVQARQCEFAKVAQHWQETPCPSLSSPALKSQKCEMPKQIALAAETCSDNIKNQNEDGIDCGGICKPCAQEKNSGIESAQKKEIAQPTGFGVKEMAGRGFAMGGVAVASFIAVVLIVFIGIRFYKNRQQ